MLKLQSITKSFPGVKALDGVSLEIRPGEVHALCGENGAGKSTLMNCLVGNIQPDDGQLYWNDEAITITSFQQARRLGIAIVYQELSVIDSLSVAENIYAGHPPLTGRGLINYPELYAQTRLLLDQLGLHEIEPRQTVGRLSISAKQMIEIAKALATRPRLLILDEPTSSLTERETQVLFRIIRQLKAEEVGIIYISHRMHEIKQISDRVSILKDGTYQGTFQTESTGIDQIIKRMVGRAVTPVAYTSHVQEEVLLEVHQLTGRGFSNVSFQLRKGEVLGFAGLVGAGRTELAQALFGANPVQSGTLVFKGKEMRFRSPGEAIRSGIAYVPEERKRLGLFLEKNLYENIASAQLTGQKYRAAGFRKTAEHYRQAWGIRTPSVEQRVGLLSGGNQQKVVLAKWLNTSPDLLIVDEPTHGVDVGAKAEIYNLLKNLTELGKGVILISSELPEVLALSDRIAVMHQGRLVRIVPGQEASEESLMQAASGQLLEEELE
jgi:ribose transport system ATP-binding protein